MPARPLGTLDPFLQHPASAPALLDADEGEEVSYGQLRQRVAALSTDLKRQAGRSLTLLYATGDAPSLVAAQACLQGRLPLCVAEAERPDDYRSLLDAYQAPLLLGTPHAPQTHRPLQPLPEPSLPAHLGPLGPTRLHPYLAVLLARRRSHRLVRLSLRNLHAAARCAAEWLALAPDDRLACAVPLSEPAGLPLAVAALRTGASLVVTGEKATSEAYWNAVEDFACTQLVATLPVWREWLLGGQHRPLPSSLRAGAVVCDLPPSPAHLGSVVAQAAALGVSLLAGYTAPETAGLFATLSGAALAHHPNRLGTAVASGQLSIESGGLTYHGPNVCLGTGEGMASLGLGDELRGVWRSFLPAIAEADRLFSLSPLP